MSEQDFEQERSSEGADMENPEDYGSLSIEDNPEGTVDPGDLAGTADESDQDVSP